MKMSKRSLASSSSPARQNKRSKGQSGQQPTIADFFSSPPKALKPKDKGKASASPVGIAAISSDEAYAWKVAQEDGLDVEKLHALEDRAQRIATAKDVEVIDVDALDTQIAPAVPSEPFPTTLASSSSTVETPPSGQLNKAYAVLPTLGSANFPDNAAASYQPLSVDPVEYTLGFDGWQAQFSVPYSFIAHALVTLSETRSRILILNTLTNTLRAITKHDPASLLPALYLLSNTLSPPYLSVELGLGPSILSKAIQQISGLSSAALRKLYNTTGDPGTS